MDHLPCGLACAPSDHEIGCIYGRPDGVDPLRKFNGETEYIRMFILANVGNVSAMVKKSLSCQKAVFKGLVTEHPPLAPGTRYVPRKIEHVDVLEIQAGSVKLSNRASIGGDGQRFHK